MFKVKGIQARLLRFASVPIILLFTLCALSIWGVKEQNKNLEHLADFDKNLSNYQTLPITEKGKQIFTPVIDNWKIFKGNILKTVSLLEKNKAEADEEAKRMLINDLSVPSQAIAKALKEADKNTDAVNHEFVTNAESEAHTIELVIVGLGIFGCIFSLVFALVLARRLSKSLLTIADELLHSGSQVTESSSQLSESSESLSSASTEAAAYLEETSASIEELSSIVKLNADHAREAASLSHTSKVSAEKGELEMTRLAEAIAALAGSSKRIEEIINVIDDIAFQTNLLALNAAVEAARAGDQGKGFAVVADAVRSLASRSAQAAKEINGLIRENMERTQDGKRIADQSAAALKEIVTSVKKVSDLNTEISSASVEQASGLTQITQAMYQLDQTTQSNAASSEEAAKTSRSLSAQSQKLQAIVDELNYLLKGERSHRSHHNVVAFKAPEKVAEEELSKASGF